MAKDRKPEGGWHLGSRTERPHAKDGWTSDREANYAEKPCPDGCTGRDNPGGFHAGRSRGHSTKN